MFRSPAYGRHWTPADDERLGSLANEGQSEGAIAAALGRSRNMVAERLAYLKLRDHEKGPGR